jgi:hypothetical protein
MTIIDLQRRLAEVGRVISQALDVDLAARRVVVRPMPGLLEEA